VGTTATGFAAWGMTLSLMSADLAAICAVSGCLALVRYRADPRFDWSAIAGLLPYIVMVFPAFAFQKLYPGLLMHPADEMRRVVCSLSAVFLIFATATFLWRTEDAYSRSALLMGWAASSPAILIGRALTRRWLVKKPWWGVPAVVLGSGVAARRMVRKFRDGRLGVKVAGVFSEDQILSWTQDMPPILGALDRAPGVVGARVAEYAIVAVAPKSNLELRRVIEDYCRGFRHVLLVPDMPGVCSMGVTARDIEGELGFELPQRLFHRGSAAAKRAIDCAASLALLAFLVPLFALIAVAIKLTSRGPVFYGHLRQGRNGKVFYALKFRTMVADADRVLADYLVSNTEAVPEWRRNRKLRNDPRITRVGKWLRRSSLDELPQLINVLIGQMSLVGPRPIVKEEIAKYGRVYGLYTRVLPGLTGLWQISGRNNTTYEERVEYDEHYVHNWSVWLDLYILVRTIKTVATGEGAY
jgi:Undecaprenyl-phosphate galactose phosphotransferase WbaP